MDYIAIIHKEAGSDFGVSFPDFPGCVTAGTTLDEAKDMAIEALTGHIAVARDYGEDIPAPSSLDDIMNNPDFQDGVAFLVTVNEPDKTVRFNVTAPQSTLERIDAAARSRGLTRSAFLVKSAIEATQQNGL